MDVDDLGFDYPEALVAMWPVRPPRSFWVDRSRPVPVELDWREVVGLPAPGDLVVINETAVEPRKISTRDGLDVLFLQPRRKIEGGAEWEVLFPARRLQDDETFELCSGHRVRLIQRGLPQVVQVTPPLQEEDFATWGRFALPPYVLKARRTQAPARPELHSGEADSKWYQTPFGRQPGSTAAPTASLHFSLEDLQNWQLAGVRLARLTLHVGLGTFLPVKVKDLRNHEMHAEWVQLPADTIAAVESVKREGRRVWALGTTVTRALEAWAAGDLTQEPDGSWSGSTRLLIRPGHEFKVVDALMTNLHQPRSTLLALVAAFGGLEVVKRSYAWAIERRFRLFSYGDLSIWT